MPPASRNFVVTASRHMTVVDDPALRLVDDRMDAGCRTAPARGLRPTVAV
jgi:hypothetical protein